MVYVSSFTYCDSIQTQILPDKGVISRINNPLVALRPVSIPGNFSFALSFNIMGFEPSEKHQIIAEFRAPNGESQRILDLEATNAKPRNNDIPVMHIDIDIRNYVLNTEGTYETSVIFDGEEIGKYNIEVMKGGTGDVSR